MKICKIRRLALCLVCPLSSLVARSNYLTASCVTDGRFRYSRDRIEIYPGSARDRPGIGMAGRCTTPHVIGTRCEQRCLVRIREAIYCSAPSVTTFCQSRITLPCRSRAGRLCQGRAASRCHQPLHGVVHVMAGQPGHDPPAAAAGHPRRSSRPGRRAARRAVRSTPRPLRYGRAGGRRRPAVPSSASSAGGAPRTRPGRATDISGNGRHARSRIPIYLQRTMRGRPATRTKAPPRCCGFRTSYRGSTAAVAYRYDPH